jgi:hypothetical protein
MVAHLQNYVDPKMFTYGQEHVTVGSSSSFHGLNLLEYL